MRDCALLTAKGVPIRMHADAPCQKLKQQDQVAHPRCPGGGFTPWHSVDIAQPPVLRSSTLDEFARMQNSEKSCS